MTAIKGFVTQAKTHPALTLGATTIIGTTFAGLPGALFGAAMGAIIVGYDGIKSLFEGTGARGSGGDPGIRPEFAGESDDSDRLFEKAFLLEADEISPSRIRSSDFGGASDSAAVKTSFFGDDSGSDDQGGDDGPPAADDDGGGGGGGSGGGSDGGSPPAASPPAAGPKPAAPTGRSTQSQAPPQKRVAMRLPAKRR